MEDGLRVPTHTAILIFIDLVLILVLMEDGLRVYIFGTPKNIKIYVLILVLVEDGLREELEEKIKNEILLS